MSGIRASAHGHSVSMREDTARKRPGEPSILLATQPAQRSEWRLAIAAILASAVVFAFAAPFASVQLAPVPLFLPIYQSALVLCDAITATLLFGQFGIVRSRAIVVLAGGYLFSASMAIFHLLSFPGLFSATGLLGSGPQTTAWLYFLWHIGFAAVVIAYALLADDGSYSTVAPRAGAGLDVAVAAVAPICVATGLTLFTTAGHDALPVIMRGDEDMPEKYRVAWATWLLTLAALPVLWRRRRLSVLNLWLMVVICAWACDVALSAVFNAGRFSLGWYAGRVYGLLSSSVLLLVLAFENTKLYRRLAESYASERDQRCLVEQKTAELNELNQSLEQRIGARTAQLESSNRKLEAEVAERQRAEAELRRSREEVRQLAALSETAREQEKARIARELHDELDQALYALKIKVDWLEQHRRADDERALSIMASMRELLDRTVSATQRIAADLRPLILDELGFAPAVEWLVDGFQQHYGIECGLVMDPPHFHLAEPYSTAVFRIVQESLTNVGRHARASSVTIRLSLRDGEIRLQVRDNGCGFDATTPRAANTFGLSGLRERTQQLSGRITIDSAPGLGTTIDVAIPLPAARGG